jgi:membrane fusion protein (multidrug efflux system)
MKKSFKITSIAAVALSATIFFAYSSTETTTAQTALILPVGIVNTTSAKTFNEYPATVEGESEVEIRPQVGGILEKIYVDEGAHVAAGQSLFKINDKVYKEQLNNANAELLAAQAAAANAKIEINKLKPLVQNNVVAEPQLETAVSNYNIALARIKQAQSVVADAKINLNYTLIKAPVAGYISRLNKKAGSLLSIGDVVELTTLSDIKDVHVYFSLSEKEFSVLKEQLQGNTIEQKLRSANKVALILAGGEQYPQLGSLDMVNGAFDKSNGAITLRASFSNDNGLLRSGNTGKIRMTFNQNDIILVPQSATTEIQDKIFVYALDTNKKVHKQIITVSGRSGNNYIVKDGLKNGEQIVLEGIEGLQDGTIVEATKGKTVATVEK